MPTVAMAGLSFGFDGPIDLISNATLTLSDGWTGLVGENGGGKTTLLRLIAGEIAPTAGELIVHPAAARCVVCAQVVDEPDDTVIALAAAWDKRSLRWQARLALEPAQLDRWQSLSPGERKRWQIGAALAGAPDILLLDEPTNHLDAVARDRLVAALAQFRGLGVVVSHDRALLEALAPRTLRLHRGELSLHDASYTGASAQWRADRQQAERCAARARDRLRAEQRKLADQRRARATAAASIPARKRMKSRHDSDARGMLAKGRARAAEARLGRDVGTQRRAVARAQEAFAAHRLDREREGDLFVGYQSAPRRWLGRLELAALTAGDRVLARDVSVALGRTDRVHVVGPNGAGKTTLLAALEAACNLGSRLLYLPQELDESARRQVSTELRAASSADRGRWLEVAARLGVDPDRALASATPSPGEARKLVIASGILRRVWALVLDEPTNHLDLPSIERLGAALAGFPGALVIASHDQAFGSALTSSSWVFEAGRLIARSPPAEVTAIR